jgi:hypothetical protein
MAAEKRPKMVYLVNIYVQDFFVLFLNRRFDSMLMKFLKAISTQKPLWGRKSQKRFFFLLDRNQIQIFLLIFTTINTLEGP